MGPSQKHLQVVAETQEQTSEQSILDRIIEEAVNKRESSLIPSDHEMEVYDVMAKMAAGTPFYRSLGGENGIKAIMLYAREIGMAPMTALNGGIYDIQGHLQISASAINEKVKTSGHFTQIKSLSDRECSVYGKRKDTGEEYTATFTIEDAARAGLMAKTGSLWVKYPQNMLFSRAFTNLARWIFPDVIKGAHVEGELDNDDQEQLQPQQPRPATIAQMASQEKEKSVTQLPKATTPISTPEPAPISVESVPEPQPQQPQPEAALQQPEAPTGNGNDGEGLDKKAKNNIIQMIANKAGKHFGGDIVRINEFLAASLTNTEFVPCMEALDRFSMAHLREIFTKVKELK